MTEPSANHPHAAREIHVAAQADAVSAARRPRPLTTPAHHLAGNDRVAINI